MKATGANYIVWCPGVMKSGSRSEPLPKALLYADPTGLPSYDFLSYEDAAQVIVSAAETSELDGKHVTALSPAAKA